MAVVAENGTGLADANSYVAVATADTYFAARNVTSWSTKTTPEKEAALIRATEFIDAEYGSQFAGIRSTAVQALAWPRAGVPGPDNVGTLPFAALPTPLLQATLEAAAIEASGGLYAGAVKASQFVIEKTVGPITTRFGRSGASIATAVPSVNRVAGMLAPLLVRRSFGITAVRA